MAAGAGPRCSSGARAGRCAGLISARASTRATERAIQDELRELDPLTALPPELAPLRPSDAPGALVAPPTEEVLPGGSARDPWAPSERGTALELGYEAGGAHASVDGEGELRLLLDRKAERSISVPAPGLYELAVHPRHERHRLRIFVGEGVELYSVSFSAGVP